MIKIGITGSIASGKTTVCKMLAGTIYPVFNADKSVKNFYKKKIFFSKIKKKLGLRNRKKLKTKIKNLIKKNKKNIYFLEKIIHPHVRKEMKFFVKKNKNKQILFFDIPLLVESKSMSYYDKIIFVNSKKPLRLNRYLDKGNKKEVFNLLEKRQLRPAKKIKYCDFIINNNSSLKLLKKNVKIIKRKLCMKSS